MFYYNSSKVVYTAFYLKLKFFFGIIDLCALSKSTTEETVG